MEQKIIETILSVAKEHNVRLNINKRETTLKDIGLDSLAMMDLIFKVEEKLDVRLDDNVLVAIKDLNDLINAFINAKK